MFGREDEYILRAIHRNPPIKTRRDLAKAARAEGLKVENERFSSLIARLIDCGDITHSKTEGYRIGSSSEHRYLTK